MDLAIFSARIFTGNPTAPWAEAIGIKDDRIELLGSRRKVQAACDRGTRVLDLPNHLVTPGLVDAHCHFTQFGSSLSWIALGGQTSMSDSLARIFDAAGAHSPGQWLLGWGWNHHQWVEDREPTAADLDAFVPDLPVCLLRACGHSLVLNSLALARCGIGPESPDPPGGRILKDPKTGQPTGLIQGGFGLVEPYLPQPTLAQRRHAALSAQEQLLKWGITGVHTCETLSNWEILSVLDEEGLLKLRVYHLLSFEELSRTVSLLIRPGYGGKRLWFGHVKLFADGSLGADTALLHQPYSDDSTKCGMAAASVNEIQQQIVESYQLGWDVAIHANGDKAVSHALTAIAGARSLVIDHRFKRDRIENAQLFRSQDLSEFQRLRLTASVQPAFLATDWEIAQRKWGTRCRHAYAWRSLLDARIPLQFGSDAPVESCSPIAGIHAAVTRQSACGLPAEGWYPDQSLTLPQALVGYTRMAAWTSRREAQLGQLTPGRLADLTVFERDLFSTTPDQWLTTRVAMTVVGGKVVFEASNSMG